jgi:RNA polymerase sigma-70 factor (ECF subfamily)
MFAYPPSIVPNSLDSDLVERARAGDELAFQALIARHVHKLSRLTARLLRTDMDRQEVLQTAMLSAWQNLSIFEGRAEFGRWIYQITMNAALMHLRAQRRRPEVAVADIEPLSANHVGFSHVPTLEGSPGWSQRPDERMQSQELWRQLQMALDALPERLRTVFLMRHIEGLSTEATAQALGLSVLAARGRLHRARVALRETMSEYAPD